MKYRLYVDEVGNPDMGASEDPNHRYLAVTQPGRQGRGVEPEMAPLEWKRPFRARRHLPSTSAGADYYYYDACLS